MNRLVAWLVAAVLSLGAVGPAAAADLNAEPCGERASFIPFSNPSFWRRSKTFYNGRLRVFLYQEDEPACCGDYIVVLLPRSADRYGPSDTCRIVKHRGTGFGTLMGMRSLGSRYDPAVGLTISFPYRVYDPETSGYGPVLTGNILVNMATRRVTAW